MAGGLHGREMGLVSRYPHKSEGENAVHLVQTCQIKVSYEEDVPNRYQTETYGCCPLNQVLASQNQPRNDHTI
jgi:hypothetical protein